MKIHDDAKCLQPEKPMIKDDRRKSPTAHNVAPRESMNSTKMDLREFFQSHIIPPSHSAARMILRGKEKKKTGKPPVRI